MYVFKREFSHMFSHEDENGRLKLWKPTRFNHKVEQKNREIVEEAQVRKDAKILPL